MTFVFRFLVVVLCLGLANSTIAKEVYEVDAAHSGVHFKVQHAGAGFTWGHFGKFSGTFTFAEKDKDSSIEFTVDTTSVDTDNDKRDDHLRGPDFLNAKEFPKAIFKSKKVKSKGDSIEVTGDLMLHGQTKQITFKMDKVGKSEFHGKTRLGLDFAYDLKIADFGIEYDGVGEIAHMYLSVEGIKK